MSTELTSSEAKTIDRFIGDAEAMMEQSFGMIFKKLKDSQGKPFTWYLAEALAERDLKREALRKSDPDEFKRITDHEEIKATWKKVRDCCFKIPTEEDQKPISYVSASTSKLKLTDRKTAELTPEDLDLMVIADYSDREKKRELARKLLKASSLNDWEQSFVKDNAYWAWKSFCTKFDHDGIGLKHEWEEVPFRNKIEIYEFYVLGKGEM